MKNQQKYDFRKEYTTVHKRIYGHKEILAESNEFSFRDGVKIFCTAEGTVTENALCDFIAYFKTRK